MCYEFGWDIWILWVVFCFLVCDFVMGDDGEFYVNFELVFVYWEKVFFFY